MAAYWVNTPDWFKKLFPEQITLWNIKGDETPTVYITFDDGPHPDVTPFVLDVLKQYNAKATFFCVGNNVTLYPAVYNSILAGDHTTGNHTYDHKNGWKTHSSTYMLNIEKASRVIKSNLFRPPYGRIRLSQIRKMRKSHPDWKLVMWSLLSADFDTTITGEQCLENVTSNIKPGSIVIFHDSLKAQERMSYALPRVLEYCQNKGWKMKAIPTQVIK